MHSHVRRLAALVMVAGLAGGTGGAAAQTGGAPGPNHRPFNPAADTENNQCVTDDGLDLNQFHGVSEQILHPPGCAQVDAGEHWTAATAWVLGETFDAVPDGFVPAGSTPLEDFVAKFVGVRYVIDPGAPQERALFFPANDRVFADSLPDTGLVLVTPLTFTIASPLPIGDHAVQVSWIMSDLHCDGLGTDIELNCLTPGETAFGTVAFEVTTRRSSAQGRLAKNGLSQRSSAVAGAHAAGDRRGRLVLRGHRPVPVQASAVTTR